MKCSATLLALACTLSGALISDLEAASNPLRILPLGDSITQADAAHDSYRRDLYKRLQSAGYVVDFVGGLHSPNNGTNYPHADFDADHEGHWGWRADQILAEVGVFATASPHDVALIHLGSNDMLQNQSVSSTISELSQIIDRLRAANPSVRILLAQIIPHAKSTGTAVDGFNAALVNLATSKNNIQNPPIILVDQHSGFSASADTYDGIHPNAGGENKISGKWFAALKPILDSVSTQGNAVLVAQTPYRGVKQSIPGKILLANYDEGGEGVAYHDSSTGNAPGNYRNDDVDISIKDGQPSIGWTVGGEWLEYTVQVTAGMYHVHVEAATPTAGGNLEVMLDGQLIGTVAVSKTGAWDAFKTFDLNNISISSSGEKTLRLKLIGTKDMYELRALTFELLKPTEPEPQNPQRAFGGTPRSIPGLIMMADYDEGGEGIAYHDQRSGNNGGVYRDDDVDININDELTSVGWAEGGEWLEYTIDVKAGIYDIELQAATPKAGGKLALLIDGQSIGTMTVSTTGSWKSFSSFHLSDVTLAQSGRKVLRLELVGGHDMYDLRSLQFNAVIPDTNPDPEPVNPQQPYQGIAQTIPGLITLSDYDEGGEGVAYHDSNVGNNGAVYRSDDVDVSIDAGKPSVGWVVGGEWLEYTLDVTAGLYDLRLEASAATAGGDLEINLDGTRLGIMKVTNTGSWSTFRTFSLSKITVAQSGRMVLRLNMLGSKDMYDLRSLNFSKHTSIPTDSDFGPGDPIAATVDWNTVERKGIRGDNWCMTHAADGNIYTMMDDGHGFFKESNEWNSKLIQIKGGPDFTAADTQVSPGWPYMKAVTRFYGYGTYAVGKRIYTWVWMSENKGYNRPIANRLIYTDDFGKTFFRWDGAPVTEQSLADTSPESFFFYKEQGRAKSGKTAYAFNWIAFCQNGQANTAAEDKDDNYVYMYAGEQYDVTRLGMIRVHKDKVCEKNAYEYLQSVNTSGVAVWTKDPAQRGTTHVFPQMNYNGEKWIWASWQPSVVYNEELDRYLMVSYGITDVGASYWSGWCKSTSENSATVIMLQSKNPWGPWKEFYREYEWKTPQAVPKGLGFTADASRTYQFKLNPKWISNGGRTMYLHWSDAGGDWVNDHGHDDFWYRWNQVKINLDIEPDEGVNGNN